MSTLKSEVESVLRSEDVEGLLQLGAPSDEYSYEAGRIADRIDQMNEPTVLQLGEIVREVCTASFGPFSAEQIEKRMPVYQRIAELLDAKMLSQ